MSTVSSSSSSTSSHIVSLAHAWGRELSLKEDQYSYDMARAWRTDDVGQDYLKGAIEDQRREGRERIQQEAPFLSRAPSQVATSMPTAPLSPPPAPTAAIEALLIGMERRITEEVTTLRAQVAAQTTELVGLRGQVTVLTGKVDDLGNTIKAVNKQVSNLVSMGFCDKVKTLVPCCNHLKKVAERGLTSQELVLVQKSKTLQQPGVK